MRKTALPWDENTAETIPLPPVPVGGLLLVAEANPANFHSEQQNKRLSTLLFVVCCLYSKSVMVTPFIMIIIEQWDGYL
jgi:hypothetical protein